MHTHQRCVPERGETGCGPEKEKLVADQKKRNWLRTIKEKLVAYQKRETGCIPERRETGCVPGVD